MDHRFSTAGLVGMPLLASTPAGVCDGTEDLGNGHHRFVGNISSQTTGQHGFSIRIIPHHRDLPAWQDMRLITWW